MKITHEKFYLYVGYGRSETKWTWDFSLSRPGYWWLLADIGVFWRKLAVSVRVGKSEIVRRRGVGEVSDEIKRQYRLYPDLGADGDWTEWEL
jgi:hypothetical protein